MTDAAAEAVPDTIGAAVRWLAARFRAAGIEGPEADARRLLAAVAGVPPHRLIAAPEHGLTLAERSRLAEVAARRLRREPVARILGRREFWGREFLLSPATLDPRPDSETLIEAALELAAAKAWRDRSIRILDIGTGTGCLVLTLLAEWPLATALATDISAEALEIAKQNADVWGVADRIDFARVRSLDGIDERFDLVLANPPYVPAGEIGALTPEVALYDPRQALDGGADGLGVYREIASGLLRVLMPGGAAVFEVGAGQAPDVTAIVTAAGPGLLTMPPRRDLAGHERCVIFVASG